jgi:hypothetical protein
MMGIRAREDSRFESFWPKFEGFQIVVQSAWMLVQATRCPMEILSLKFKATMKDLQSWSDKNVGNFKHQLGLAKENVHQMEIPRDHRQLHQQERWLLCNLKKHSLALSSLL